MTTLFRRTRPFYVPLPPPIDKSKCHIENCNKPAKYVIKWYGLNQFRKNPRVADERSVCDNFEHILESSFHDNYGGVPDGIVDFETLDIEHPDIVRQVVRAMGGGPFVF